MSRDNAHQFQCLLFDFRRSDTCSSNRPAIAFSNGTRSFSLSRAREGTYRDFIRHSLIEQKFFALLRSFSPSSLFSLSLFSRIGRSRLFDEIDFTATIVRSFRTSALFRNRGENVPGKDTFAFFHLAINLLPLPFLSDYPNATCPRGSDSRVLVSEQNTRAAIPKDSPRRISPVNKEYFYFILISRQNRAKIESVLRGGIVRTSGSH